MRIRFRSWRFASLASLCALTWAASTRTALAGGGLSTGGEASAKRIAPWNCTTRQPLGSGMNSDVDALTVYNGNLIAGGFFTTAGGASANRIAQWNGTSWQPLGSGVNNTV